MLSICLSRGLPACQPVNYNSLLQPSEALRTQLETALRQRQFDAYLEAEKLAVSLVDLSHNPPHAYAGLNDDRMMYAASLPKIAILLANMNAVAGNRIAWDRELALRLKLMITASSNSDASWATHRVGLQAIADAMQAREYCFYEAGRGGLWMGKPYAKGGPVLREPLRQLSHAATTRQTARFYALLDAGKLISPHWSQRMLELMSPPLHNHKFVGGIGHAGGVEYRARKSGTWGNFHSDSVLIQHYAKRFILVALSELDGGENILREVAHIAHEIIRSNI